MKVLLLGGFTLASFVSFFLFTNKKKILSDYILSIWIIFTAILLLIYYLNFDNYLFILKNAKHYPTWLIKINLPFFLGQAPFLYLYVLSLIGHKKIKYTHLLYFLPVVFSAILLNFIYDFRALDKINFSINELPFSFSIWLFYAFFLSFMTFVIYKSFELINNYQKMIQDNRSETHNADIKWLQLILYINISFWVIIFFLATMKNYNIIASAGRIALSIAAVFIFVISYMGFKRPNIFIKQYQDFNIRKKKVSNLTNTSNEYLEKLLNHMHTAKPYLNSSLSIKELADDIGIPAYQLSQIINQQIGKSFFDFINAYRVDEVKKQIMENEKYKLIAIAYDCGFNSKSSFNRIFKNQTGQTPSQFIKQNQSAKK